MMFPDSLVILPLLAGFCVSMWTHYRTTLPDAAAPFGWPFVVGLAALLGLFGFLALIVIAPDWAGRKPGFLALGVLLLVAAFIARRRATRPAKPTSAPVRIGQLPPALRQAITEQAQKSRGTER